jgi:hypothetical protein
MGILEATAPTDSRRRREATAHQRRKPEPSERPVDTRIAGTGGRQLRSGDPKSGYTWLGMAAPADWGRTLVHEHTRWYGCARCGVKFTGPSGPQAVYTHMAKVHGR